MSKELFEIVQRVTTDEEFRAEFMADPRKSLSELGIPVETVERLVIVLTTALVSGPVILRNLGPMGSDIGWR